MTSPADTGRIEPSLARSGSAPLRWVQHRRKGAFVAVAIVWTVAVAFVEPASAGPARIALFAAGIALIASGAILRVWAAIHVAGHKSLQLVTDGPYARTRNPLYLGTLAGVAGAAISFGSLSMAALLVLAAFLILNWVVGREEERLREEFGARYGDYARRTPKWLLAPAPGGTGKGCERLEIQVGNVVRTLAESLLFLIAPIMALAFGHAREAGWMEPLVHLP